MQKLRFGKNKNYWGDGKQVIVVKNKHGVKLGTIEYYAPWGYNVWEQDEEVMMSADCLKQIHEKLVELDKKKEAL